MHAGSCMPQELPHRHGIHQRKQRRDEEAGGKNGTARQPHRHCLFPMRTHEKDSPTNPRKERREEHEREPEMVEMPLERLRTELITQVRQKIGAIEGDGIGKQERTTRVPQEEEQSNTRSQEKEEHLDWQTLSARGAPKEREEYSHTRSVAYTHGMRRPYATLLLLHTIFFAFLFAPFLGGTRLFGGDADAALFHYPVMRLFAERAFSRDLLWNDLNFHGFPTFLGQAYPLHPLLGIFTLLGTSIAALNWTIALHPLLGAFFFSILIRQEGISTAGSFIAGLAYAVALRSWFFDVTITGLLPLFPLLLLSVRHAAKNHWVALPGGAAVIALAWYTLHFHFTLLLLTGAGLYCLAHAVRNRNRVRAIVFAFGGMVALGTMMGLARLLPTLAYGLLSFRTEMPLAYVMDRGIGTRYPLLYLFPHFPFPLLRGGADFSPYVGPVILACIIAGIAHCWRERRVRLLLAIYAVTLILAMRNSPLYALLYHIPPFNFLRSPTRWPLIGAFALAAVAGMGFDVLAQNRASRSRTVLAWTFCGIGALAAAGGAAAALLPLLLKLFPGLGNGIIAIAAAFQPHASTREAGYLASIIAKNYGIGNPTLLLPTVAMIFAGVALHPKIWDRIADTKRRAALAASAALTLLIVIFPTQIKSSKDIATYATPTGVQQFLKQEGGLSLSFLPGSAMRAALQTGTYKTSLPEIQRAELSYLPANMNLFRLSPSADYYDRLASKRMGRLLALVGADRPSIAPEETLAMQPSGIQRKMEELRERRSILDILNVRHIVSGWPLETVGFAKEFTEEVTDGRIPVSVYGNPSARPFAYFVKNAELMEPNAEAAYARLRDRAWKADETLIECQGCSGRQSFTAKGTIDILRRSPIFLETQTSSSSPQWLVLSQNFLPGWSLHVDGSPARGALAHSSFAAAFLPTGNHTVTLSFTLRKLFEDSWSLVARRDAVLWR